MKRDLDRARLKLQTITPETQQMPRLRIARQLSLDCTDEMLATLLNEVLDQQRLAQQELHQAEAKMHVIMQARGLRHRG
jgi:hypothetical protein